MSAPGLRELLERSLEIEGFRSRALTQFFAPAFTRRTSELRLSAGEFAGYGEVSSYDADVHRALDAGPAPIPLPWRGTLAEWEAALAHLESPEVRWALGTAALELLLARDGLDWERAGLADPLALRTVISTELGRPPQPERLADHLARDPGAEFKLDFGPWTREQVERLSAVAGGQVAVLDFKRGRNGSSAFPVARLDALELAFPNAWLEDPAPHLWPACCDGDRRRRVSFEIHEPGQWHALPCVPGALNLKPGRMGSFGALLEACAWALEHRVQLYLGGDFELGVGREHLRRLAAWLCPDGPNDLAWLGGRA
ncbi:MAG: hypothetical protein ACYS26_01770 [Planctomycetota bacterium]|jgi:hypothetical protein